MTLRAIVTDIEGTTSSIDFVHRTLFPYARQRLRAYLQARAGETPIGQIRAQVAAEERRELSIDELASILERWIDEDRKATPLKALQGMIWAEGYAAGELKGHVYADTPVALRRWHAQGLKLYVYSSGSVEAQKLIFGHTEYGDLTPLFSGYFDTRVGGKREAASYRAILGQIALPGDEALFLSDVGEELDAAREAAMQTMQIVRDGKTKPCPAHAQARDFDAILP